MTIRRNLNAAEMSGRLALIETMDETAPVPLYFAVRSVRELIGEKCDDLIRDVHALNLAAPNCDQIREVESVMYAYVADANPHPFEAAEQFGRSLADAKTSAPIIAREVETRPDLNPPPVPALPTREQTLRDFLRSIARGEHYPDDPEGMTKAEIAEAVLNAIETRARSLQATLYLHSRYSDPDIEPAREALVRAIQSRAPRIAARYDMRTLLGTLQAATALLDGSTDEPAT